VVRQAARGVLGLVAGTLLVLVAFAEYYGVWLLTTDDPDGGRHPVGTIVVVGSSLVGIVALGLLILAIRPRSAARAFRGKPPPLP
jgi:hypothetical protein